MPRLFPDGTKLVRVESSYMGDGDWKEKLVPCTYSYHKSSHRAHWVTYTDGRRNGGIGPGIYGYTEHTFETKEMFLAAHEYRIASSGINTLGNFPKKEV